MPTGQRAPQTYPLITPSHPFARPSNFPNPPRAGLPRPSYPHVRYQGDASSNINSPSTSQGLRGKPSPGPSYPDKRYPGQSPGNTTSDSPSRPPSWSDINDRRDRLNDIVSGADSARANFDSASKAWNEGRYIDTLFDSYQSVNGGFRALRGVLALASVAADQAGYQRAAEFLKNTADDIKSARFALAGVLSPVSSFRGLASVLTDPSSTRADVLSSGTDYATGLGQSTGLAILQLDRRKGDTPLKQFGYGMFTLAEGGSAANQVISGYSQAYDALGEGDFKTATKAALGATTNLVEGPQIAANYLADTFDTLGMKQQATRMYEVSARLLTVEIAVKSVAAILNPLLDDSKEA
ncbi:hypothetical protein ACFFJT_15110 [Dyella flava]|uniref:Uncharacterized protein n=1 Tax=Dyella flava TaxID=1920170 RepID=A0ABS2K2V3_9GAMM|nr:hypothetical protein [Dyella flava]MBM7125568.1 hypothetical protein [Dyella flava]